jgi:dienelactone hydrolase
MIAALLLTITLGQLQPGPHAVGFRVIEKYDASRPYLFPLDLDGKPRRGVIERPMQIAIWYPAIADSRAKMTLGEYVALMAREQDFSATGDGTAAYFNFDRVRGATSEQRAKLLALETMAVRDAAESGGKPPHSKKFPVILWSLGSPALYHASAEYLASHGYVVAIMPRIPAVRSLVDTAQTREDYDAKSRDMAFLIGELSAFPSADIRNIGVTGFSAGGRWAIGEAMRNPSVRGVISHDSILNFGDDAQFASMPFYAPDRVRVPVLHLIRREWVPRETSKLWTDLQNAYRAKWIFETPLDHLDFTGVGYAATLAGMHEKQSKAIAETFHTFNRATLAFFDWTLKGGEPVTRTTDASITVETLPAMAQSPDPRQIQEALIDDTDRAIALARTAKLPETTLNLAGYQLLALGRRQDALRVFAANAEIFPNSANVYDSLADGYQAVGDRAKALELSRKVLELLDKDQSVTPERRELIRRSAEGRIQSLSG